MRRAASSGMSPDQFAQAVVEGGQVPMLVGEVARGKALAVVVEAAKVVDTNGEVVDLEDDEDETEAAAETVEAAVEGDDDAEADRGEDRGLSLALSPYAGPRTLHAPGARSYCASACAPGTLRSERTVREAGWRCPTCALGSMNTRAGECPAAPSTKDAETAGAVRDEQVDT